MKKYQIGGSTQSRTSSDELNPNKMKSKVAPNPSFVPSGSMNKMQRGGSTLSKAELDALSHQKRGMGTVNKTFVKKAGGVKNETGTLTDAQVAQLKKYMSKASTAKSTYEGLPNIGRMLGHGNSAADIPKGSQLENQKKGGQVKKSKKY